MAKKTVSWDEDTGHLPAVVETALDARYVPRWKPNTVYTLGQQVVSPTNDVVSAKIAFTSGATYLASNWTQSSTFALLSATQVVATASAATNVANLQAALDATAGLPHALVRIVGIFPTNATITVKGNLDARGAVLNYSGAGTAIVVGVTAPTQNFTIDLPAVNNTSKVGTGWAAGAVGVKLLNLDSCIISVPHVTGFETGLMLRGEGQGCCYNTITLGGLDNNKRNLMLDADATGWANQNMFLGGRFSHDSAEGTAVTGTRHVLFTAPANVINTNVWVNASMEGSGAEFFMDIAGGMDNEWIAARFEHAVTGAPVRWGAAAQRNRIRGGYMADQIVATNVAGSQNNTVQTTHLFQVLGSDGSGSGLMRLSNESSATQPALAISDTENFAAWTWHHTAQRIEGKRPGDAYPRIILDAVNGAILFGTGGAAPTDSFLAQGGGGISIKGHVAADSNNVYDIGSGGYNPRYIRASTALQCGSFATGSRPAAATAGSGAMVFDTTLGKPIWSTGAVWKDATGTTV